jgi:hypothetical protein
MLGRFLDKFKEEAVRRSFVVPEPCQLGRQIERDIEDVVGTIVLVLKRPAASKRQRRLEHRRWCEDP